VAKSRFALLVVALASGFAGAQNVGAISGESLLDRPAASVGSAVTCSQPPHQTFEVPKAIAERAKLKAHLANLLRESLFDDTKGIVNIAREKEIRKLASKLRRAD